MCPLGSAPGQSVEEEGSVEGIQERQQPQGLPARGGQLAPLQLVQQVSLKYCTCTHPQPVHPLVWGFTWLKSAALILTGVYFVGAMKWNLELKVEAPYTELCVAADDRKSEPRGRIRYQYSVHVTFHNWTEQY